MERGGEDRRKHIEGGDRVLGVPHSGREKKRQGEEGKRKKGETGPGRDQGFSEVPRSGRKKHAGRRKEK